MRPAVFLDRDGVLNELVVRNGCKVSPRGFEDFQLLPGVSQAVELLKQAGFLAVVVTNQPDVARGFLDPGNLDLMHKQLREAVCLDAIYVCCHDDADECDCRKPKPGLILRAVKEWQIDLSSSFLTGDSWRDIEAARAVACRTVLVKSANQQYAGPKPDFMASDLADAVEVILSGAWPRR